MLQRFADVEVGLNALATKFDPHQLAMSAVWLPVGTPFQKGDA